MNQGRLVRQPAPYAAGHTAPQGRCVSALRGSRCLGGGLGSRIHGVAPVEEQDKFIEEALGPKCPGATD